MLQALASMVGGAASGASLSATQTNDGISLSLPLTGETATDDLTADAATGLLTAYLLVFHHGGRLALQAENDHNRYVMTLPANPSATVLPPPRAGWLEPLLVRLEGWD